MLIYIAYCYIVFIHILYVIYFILLVISLSNLLITLHLFYFNIKTIFLSFSSEYKKKKKESIIYKIHAQLSQVDPKEVPKRNESVNDESLGIEKPLIVDITEELLRKSDELSSTRDRTAEEIKDFVPLFVPIKKEISTIYDLKKNTIKHVQNDFSNVAANFHLTAQFYIWYTMHKVYYIKWLRQIFIFRILQNAIKTIIKILESNKATQNPISTLQYYTSNHSTTSKNKTRATK